MTTDAIAFFLNRYGLTTGDLDALLGEALAAGGDYADLYFEYCRTNALNLEERLIKTANRSVAQGVGVRVIAGEKTGYAYTDDISPASIRQAARTAACIAQAAQAVGPVAVTPQTNAHDLYPQADAGDDLPIERKIELLKAIDERCYAADRRIQKVQASLADEWKVVMVATSEGVLAGDIQPLARVGVVCIADQDGELRAGRAGGGGRRGFGMFTGNWPRRRWRARPSGWPCCSSTPWKRPPAPWKSSWGMAGPASCSTKPSGTGWKPISTARKPPPFPTCSDSGWPVTPVPLWMTERFPAGAARSIWMTKGTPLPVPCSLKRASCAATSTTI